MDASQSSVSLYADFEDCLDFAIYSPYFYTILFRNPDYLLKKENFYEI